MLGWSAYHVADSTGMVKLDAMENPWSLPESVRQAMALEMARAPVNRYPDPACTALKSALRSALGLPTSAPLLLGNGSDELIQILCAAVARPGAVVMGVEPSFVMYRVSAAAAGVRYVGVPLRADFSLDLAALEAALAEHRPALLFLACPNNPTGNLFDRDQVLAVLAQAPGLVVVDEAYHAFARQTFLGDLTRFPNLLVMRTLSKLGLAGLRLGVLAGSEAWLSQLDKLRLPYNVNVLSQLAAGVALGHLPVLEAQAAAILEERALLARRLAALTGVEVFPSEANFLTFRVAGASAVFAGLLRRGVLIKNLGAAHPLLRDCLRVTVGTPDENGRFLTALSEAIATKEEPHG